MAANGNNDSRKRLEILEKAYLEDRERWRASEEERRKNDERWQKNDDRWQKNDERWRANDERWRANDERFNRMLDEFREDFQDIMKTIVEHGRQIRKLEASNEATLRILRRLLEK
jgi:hypothetical protein